MDRQKGVSSFDFFQFEGTDWIKIARPDGTYDFVIEWTPQFNGPLPPGETFQPDPTGPTFLEALKEQLGFKLESQTGPVDMFVVDHVEEPLEN